MVLVASSGPYWVADAFAVSALSIGTGVYSVPRVIATSVYCVSRDRRRTRHAIDATDATTPATRRTGSTSRTLDGNELIKIGDLHEVQNHLQEALPYYQRALTAFRGKKDRNGEATALVRIAIVMERQDKHEEASKALETAIPLLNGVGQERDGGL